MAQLIFSNKEENKVRQLPINKIKPNKMQPRFEFEEEKLESLADSIKENGVLQPLTVRKISQFDYELISGERRLRASKLLGLSTVPCIVLSCDDKQSAVYALIENLQRADLSFFEEAEGIKRLIDEMHLTQGEAARKLGKRQSTIANKLRILQFDIEERDIIVKNNLTERHARALLRIKDKEHRMFALSQIVKNNLNVQQSEILINKIISEDEENKKPPINRKVIIKDVRIFMNTIDKAIETMKASGIDAITEQKETGLYIEYTVKIPKESVFKKHLA